MIKNSKHSTILIFFVGFVAALGGCSTLEKNVPSIGSIFTKTDESVAVEGVYYTGSPGMPLYRSPGGVSLKSLPQYTKLYRDKLDSGFAHVRVDSTGETGWVENAKLIWRLPKPISTEQAHETTSQPAVELAAPQITEPPPPQPAIPQESPSPTTVSPSPAAASPSSAPSKPSVAPSIYNPY